MFLKNVFVKARKPGFSVQKKINHLNLYMKQGVMASKLHNFNGERILISSPLFQNELL